MWDIIKQMNNSKMIDYKNSVVIPCLPYRWWHYCECYGWNSNFLRSDENIIDINFLSMKTSNWSDIKMISYHL
jgi:hypothetical protein